MLLQAQDGDVMELGRLNRVNKKRKAEHTDSNERLSKRLSLLNLERNGQKLYVPVEAPSASSSTTTTTTNVHPKPFLQPNYSTPLPKAQNSSIDNDDSMHIDNTKHKVYIYDLDAELSDSDTSDDGRLVFLPDIAKHLRETRIPPSVLANQDGELAGMNKELVLYNVPSSLSVPEEQDGVRKAILEARARMRAKMEGKSLENDSVERRDFAGVSQGGFGNARVGQQELNSQIPWHAPTDLVEDDIDPMDLG